VILKEKFKVVQDFTTNRKGFYHSQDALHNNKKGTKQLYLR